MKNFIITIMFGQNSEYFNSNLSNNDYTTNNIEQAEGFDSKESAEWALEKILKPHAEKNNWQVEFSIDECQD